MREGKTFARGVQPFWFWNGTIQADEVARQIRAMKAQGVRGFFLHPRQGMDLPYLSQRFLDMIGVAVDTARHEHMEMWLYDEYPYPSGIAGGELLLTPEYEARVLKSDMFDACGHVERLLPWGKVLLARAYRLQAGEIDWQSAVDLQDYIGIVYEREIMQPVGLSAYNQKRFFTGAHAKKLWWDAPAGDWRVLIFLECAFGDFKYFGGFVDPVNPQAMREYIRLTHERYYRAFPEAFGPVIKGVFTDETAPMGHNPMWSPCMPGLYEARYGESLIERLPAFLTPTAGDDEKFRYDYHDTLYRAFVDSYDRPIRQWCDAHDVLYVGEKVHMRAEQLRHMHIPGIDSGHTKAGGTAPVHASHHRANAKSAASYAHFTGDNTALCEAYHSLGWDATLRDLRWIADWLIVQGISLLVPHAYYYSDDALRKYDAPPSLFESMPWFAHNTLLTAHVEHLGDLVRDGERAVHTLVVDTCGVRMAQQVQPGRGESPLAQLEFALTANHIDHYVIDRDLLAELTAADGKIFLHGEAFHALLLPDLEIAEAETVEAARRAASAGAQVIAVGHLPRRNITTGEALPEGMPGVVSVPSPEACVAMLAQTLPVACRILAEGENCADIMAARFLWQGETWLYTVNLTREMHACALSLPDLAGIPIAQVEPHTGAAMRAGHDAAAFTHTYAPFACALFRTGEAAAEEAATQVTIDPAMAYPCAPRTANLLRMGLWAADLGGNRLQVDSLPVINQLTVTKSKIEAVERSDFGCVKRLQFPPMALQYTFRFDNQYDGPVRFVMEPGSIHGEHMVLLNGKPLPALRTQFVFKRTNLACDVGGLLKSGMNELTVLVQAEHDDDGVINPLYFAGDFAVRKVADTWTLLPPGGAASPLAPADNGYPFFSGIMEYDVSGLFAPEQTGRVQVSIADWRFEHCAELLVDGISLGAAAWQPYAWTADIPAGARVTLRVYGTLLAAYEGAQFDQDTHQTIFLQRPEV